MPIHVFESAGNIIPIEFEDKPKNFYKSYAWTISAQNANNLIGDYMFFHATKTSVAREGGIIQHWEYDENDDVVFIVEFDTELRGAVPPRNWPRQDWVIV